MDRRGEERGEERGERTQWTGEERRGRRRRKEGKKENRARKRDDAPAAEEAAAAGEEGRPYTSVSARRRASATVRVGRGVGGVNRESSISSRARSKGGLGRSLGWRRQLTHACLSHPCSLYIY